MREIVQFKEDIASSSTKESQHQHSSGICTIQPWDLLDPQRVFSSEVSAQLAGGDYHTKQYLASEKGHKYVKLFNPTFASVEPLLDKIKDPSVLLLQGCTSLLQYGSFPFDKFKSITILEISGCPHLATLPEHTFSRMKLQSLNLSYLQINHLPYDMFYNKEDSLRSLVIRGCSNLHELPIDDKLRMLKDLDLSYLPIETLPRGIVINELRSLILRGCSKLQSLQLERISQLQFLDLCYCTSLIATQINTRVTSVAIDLSYTTFSCCNLERFKDISHLFFRNAKLCKLEVYFPVTTMKVCDLSGNQGLRDVSRLEGCCGLEALNLSRTAIESIDFLSEFTSLRTLVLRECTRLEQLPTIEQLENLEVLDLSGCEIMCDLPRGLSKQRRLKEINMCGCKSLTELEEGLFDDMISLEKLDISNTDIKNLPSFANLINRGTVIKHSCVSGLESSSSVSTELSNLVDLCSDNVDNRQEFHLVSTFISNSGFDKFIYKFTELSQYISTLEKLFTRTGVKMQYITFLRDLDYIRHNIDLLESSQNSKACEELLHRLMNYDLDNYDDDDDSILKNLIRTVVKLKLLVPRTLPPPTEPDKKGSDSKRLYTRRKESELINKYESLTTIQRNCLLYFACLVMALSGEKSVTVKEHILIHLWYAEGFFDPLLYANSTSNLIPDRKDAKEQSSTSKTNRTIEEIGRDVLDALDKGKFISSKTKGNKWYIVNVVGSSLHNNGTIEEGWLISFLIKKAMEEHLFDFNERGKLTLHFGVSRRAIMLKSAIDHPPSSRVWLNYTKTSEQLESFKAVRTLLYIDERVVDINTKWFSSMTNLHVLHLVNLDPEFEQINIVDLKFLEELKRMKQLRLLNLESFAAIQKLPDSICQLTNLGILNLAYCSNMTELPAGIASLTSLIILDLTQCHLLSELPKGLSSLSKLEVLKGFPITYEVSGKQSRKACTLRELLKLERLRKLNLVVNRDSFPDSMDLQVLRSMKELRNLKITWHPTIYKEEELGDAVDKGALRQSRWMQFKCWGLHNEIEKDGLLLTTSCLGNLNKLVLCCFPFETEPNWLNPTELQNLEKLYIEGGSLRTLFQGYTDQSTWNIKDLKLTRLLNLELKWPMIKGSFPCVKPKIINCGYGVNTY